MGYLAIIGDFVESRSIGDRAEFQRGLTSLFDSLSHRNETVISPYTITLGDEFQAVYTSADGVFADLLTVFSEVYPQKTRIAVGVGTLSTDINRTSAIGMDGPAFHQARAALEQLKSIDDTVVQLAVDRPRNKSAIDLANQGLLLFADMSRTWKANTWVIARETMKGSPVDPIADTLSITPRAVYKNIRTNGVRTVVGLCTQATGLLADEMRER